MVIGKRGIVEKEKRRASRKKHAIEVFPVGGKTKIENALQAELDVHGSYYYLSK
jgi:hypothetical protein